MIVAVIPTRGGSKGVPGKNIFLLNGRPLIHYTLDAAKGSIADEVWVVSDSQEILDEAERCQQVKTLKCPDNLTQDNSQVEGTLMYFTENVMYDIMVFIQATSPLITYEYINAGLKKMLSGGYDSVFSAVPTSDILFWNTEEMKPVNYNYDPKKRERRQTRISPYVIESGAFYIVKRDVFVKSACRFGGKIGYVEVPFWTYPQVDSMEDLENIERLMK
jgi:N-acylneuraminate cytidylyltransferase